MKTTTDKLIDDTALVIAELATKIIVEGQKGYMEDYLMAVNKYVSLVCEDLIATYRLRDRYHVPTEMLFKTALENRIRDFKSQKANLSPIIEFANLVSKISNGFRNDASPIDGENDSVLTI